MKIETGFGVFFTEGHVPKHRLAVIKRAMEWCESLGKELSTWSRVDTHRGRALQRKVEGKCVQLYPLAAARQDCGDFSTGFAAHHVPITVEKRRVCVTIQNKTSGVPHLDMVAACILLLGAEKIQKNRLPSTLRNAIYGVDFHNGHRYGYWDDNEAVAAFHREVTTDAEAAAFILAHPRDWRALREQLSWNDHPDSTMHFVNTKLNAPMGEETSDDVIWALLKLFRWNPDVFQQRLARFLEHPEQEVVLFALRRLTFDGAEHAQRVLWRRCYDDGPLAWMFHQRLQEWPELHDELVLDTVDMVSSSTHHDFRLRAVAWLSNHVDMDATVKELFEEDRDFGRRCELLWNVRTRGPWLGELAMSYVKVPHQSLRHAFVCATISNRSFDAYPFWKALMDEPKTMGQVKQRILGSLDRVTPEQGLSFLEIGMKVNLRFVQKTALKAMKAFPYSDVKHLLQIGLDSDFKGVQDLAKSVARHFGVESQDTVDD